MIVDRWKKLQSYIATRIRLGGLLPNDGYLTGVPKNVVSEQGAGNVGTGLDTLHSYTFVAKSLNVDRANFRAFYGLAFGSNDDNKRVTVDFGGSNLMDTGLVDIDAWGGTVWVDGKRDDATHASIQVTIILGNTNIDSAGGVNSAGAKYFSTNANFLAVNNMDTNSNDLILKAESSTATNDNISCSIARIDLVRF